VLARYAVNLIASGGIPPSVLEHPDELAPEQAAALRDQWVIARAAGVGLPAVLSGGVTWKPTSISPTDMALVELTQNTEARIAALLGVPPFLVGLPSGGDSMTYSNVSSLFDYHWRAGLRPKAETVCKAISGWALPAGTTFEVNRDEYVRPDPYTRAQTWQILIGAGVLTAEQVAAIERYNLGAPLPLGSGEA
jgi:HK97 family phage portal protein